MKRRLIPALLLSGLIAFGPAVQIEAAESVSRRMETVFFIALPFASLYSALLALGAAAIIQKGEVRFTVGYQIATAGLASIAAGWVAWKDSKDTAVTVPPAPAKPAAPPDTPK